nr:spidroin-1-like [Aegilops tauschii subsp. strangulata]
MLKTSGLREKTRGEVNLRSGSRVHTRIEAGPDRVAGVGAREEGDGRRWGDGGGAPATGKGRSGRGAPDLPVSGADGASAQRSFTGGAPIIGGGGGGVPCRGGREGGGEGARGEAKERASRDLVRAEARVDEKGSPAKLLAGGCRRPRRRGAPAGGGGRAGARRWAAARGRLDPGPDGLGGPRAGLGGPAAADGALEGEARDRWHAWSGQGDGWVAARLWGESPSVAQGLEGCGNGGERRLAGAGIPRGRLEFSSLYHLTEQIDGSADDAVMKADTEWSAIAATLIRRFYVTILKDIFHTVISKEDDACTV